MVCSLGYEATQQRTKDGGGKYEHELRLTGPGLKTYIFYAKDKVEAELWVIVSVLSSSSSSSSPSSWSSSLSGADKSHSEDEGLLQRPEDTVNWGQLHTDESLAGGWWIIHGSIYLCSSEVEMSSELDASEFESHSITRNTYVHHECKVVWELKR